MTQYQRTTRYPNGVGNTLETKAMEDIPFLNPRRFNVFFDDFDTFIPTAWVVTETQAGATQTIGDADGGVLLLSNTAADNDLIGIQGPGEVFLFDPTLMFIIEAKFALDVVVESDFIAGAYVRDTSPLASLPTDGIFFYKADGAADLVFSLRKGGVSTSVALGAMTASTFITCSAVWNPLIGEWKIYVNDVLKAIATDNTTAPNTTELAPGIAVQNGDPAAVVASIDLLFLAKARTN